MHLQTYSIFYAVALNFIVTSASLCNEYPTSAQERRREEMGSILGGEGIIMRFNTARPVVNPKGSYNAKAVWRSAIKTLSKASIEKIDIDSGILVTQWFEDEYYGLDKLLKITVLIDDNKKTDEVIEVLGRIKSKKKAEQEQEMPKDLRKKIKERILARSLT